MLDSFKNINIDFEYDFEQNESHVVLNGRNVEAEIRGLMIADLVSVVSSIPEVRTFIVSKLREYGKNRGIVMDGRDIGTVVFPEAELKIFMTADEKVRSERRYNEMKNKGMEVTKSQVSQNLSGRDLLDSTRRSSPLKKAADAVEIDNTLLTEQEQFELVLRLAKEKIVSAA